MLCSRAISDSSSIGSTNAMRERRCRANQSDGIGVTAWRVAANIGAEIRTDWNSDDFNAKVLAGFVESGVGGGGNNNPQVR